MFLYTFYASNCFIYLKTNGFITRNYYINNLVELQMCRLFNCKSIDASIKNFDCLLITVFYIQEYAHLIRIRKSYKCSFSHKHWWQSIQRMLPHKLFFIINTLNIVPNYYVNNVNYFIQYLMVSICTSIIYHHRKTKIV